MALNKLLLAIFFCACCTVQCSKGGHVTEGEKETNEEHSSDSIPGSSHIQHGVNRVNLQWIKEPAKVEEIAANIASAQIPLARISGVKKGGSISQVIENINAFSAQNIRVLLIQPMWFDMFPEGYEQIPGPSFPVYKMSDIDTARFRSFMENFLSAIASGTPAGAVVGIELFNEANWGGFNGDLQPTESGKGAIFTLETPLNTPAFADSYAGIIKYGQCLRITRQLINSQLPGRNVKLITNGLVAGTGWNDHQFARNHGFSMVLPGMFLTLLQGTHPGQADTTNYLNFTDAIGLHSYPPLRDDMEEILNTYYFDPIEAVVVNQKPYWITEWGFDRKKFTDTGGETARLRYINRFIEALERIRSVELSTFYEFDLSTNHNIWENGALLESGTFFENVND